MNNSINDLFVSGTFGGIATIFFLLFLIIYLVVSIILFYHWDKYGMGHKKIIIYGSTFVIGSAIFFLFGFISLSNI